MFRTITVSILLYFILNHSEHILNIFNYFQGCSDFQSETLMNPPKEPSKTHKRFKLNNEENKQQDDDTSESSDDDCLQVTREVFTCNSTPSRNFAEKNNMFQPGM